MAYCTLARAPLRGTLADAAGNGGALDNPDAVFITVNRNDESHGISSTKPRSTLQHIVPQPHNLAP